jgi:hypothetical protein
VLLIRIKKNILTKLMLILKALNRFFFKKDTKVIILVLFAFVKRGQDGSFKRGVSNALPEPSHARHLSERPVVRDGRGRDRRERAPMEMTWVTITASLAMGLAAAFGFIFAVKRDWFRDLEEAKYQVFWSDCELGPNGKPLGQPPAKQLQPDESVNASREAADDSQSEKN